MYAPGSVQAFFLDVLAIIAGIIIAGYILVGLEWLKTRAHERKWNKR